MALAAATVATLLTEVTAAISNTTLVELTNDDHSDPNATVNETRLGKAIEAAAGRFEVLSGFQIRTDDPSHINALIEGVSAILASWKGGDTEEHRERSIRFGLLCKELREPYTATPGGNSLLTPSPDTDNLSVTVRPDMDRRNFTRRYLPKPRRGGNLFNDEY